MNALEIKVNGPAGVRALREYEKKLANFLWICLKHMENQDCRWWGGGGGVIYRDFFLNIASTPQDKV